MTFRIRFLFSLFLDYNKNVRKIDILLYRGLSEKED